MTARRLMRVRSGAAPVNNTERRAAAILVEARELFSSAPIHVKVQYQGGGYILEHVCALRGCVRGVVIRGTMIWGGANRVAVSLSLSLSLTLSRSLRVKKSERRRFLHLTNQLFSCWGMLQCDWSHPIPLNMFLFACVDKFEKIRANIRVVGRRGSKFLLARDCKQGSALHTTRRALPRRKAGPRGVTPPSGLALPSEVPGLAGWLYFSKTERRTNLQQNLAGHKRASSVRPLPPFWRVAEWGSLLRPGRTPERRPR